MRILTHIVTAQEDGATVKHLLRQRVMPAIGLRQMYPIRPVKTPTCTRLIFLSPSYGRMRTC